MIHIAGLSEVANYDEIHRLRPIMEAYGGDNAFHPVTLLATQLNECVDATNLQARLKMSAYERDMAIFLSNHKNSSNFDDLL